MDKAHEERVRAFMKQCREEDPKRVADVCDKYPVQSSARKHIIRNREITVGLLGLQRSRISNTTAGRYDLESIYMDQENE